jgi:hypothetical protein
VERAQRSLLKAIFKKPLRYPTTELYKECELLSMRKLYILLSLIKTAPYLKLYIPQTQTRRRKVKVHRGKIEVEMDLLMANEWGRMRGSLRVVKPILWFP